VVRQGGDQAEPALRPQPADPEAPYQQRLVADRGSDRLAADNTLQTHGLHQAPDGAAGGAITPWPAFPLGDPTAGAAYVTGLLAPLHVLFHRAGAMLAVIASALWGATTVLEKLSIEHVTPSSGPFVALVGTALMVVLLTPGTFLSSEREGPPAQKGRWSGLQAHPRALITAVVLAGIAPLFGFTAIALGLVGYVTALFKLSSVLTIIWAWLFLGEEQIQKRLLGTSVMLIGGILVALF